MAGAPFVTARLAPKKLLISWFLFAPAWAVLVDLRAMADESRRLQPCAQI